MQRLSMYFSCLSVFQRAKCSTFYEMFRCVVSFSSLFRVVIRRLVVWWIYRKTKFVWWMIEIEHTLETNNKWICWEIYAVDRSCWSVYTVKSRIFFPSEQIEFPFFLSLSFLNTHFDWLETKTYGLIWNLFFLCRSLVLFFSLLY